MGSCSRLFATSSRIRHVTISSFCFKYLIIMLDVKFSVLFDRRGRADKETKGQVEISAYVDNYHRRFIATGVSVYPYQWCDGVVKYHEKADEYNAKICEMLSDLEDRVAQIRYRAGRRLTADLLIDAVKKLRKDDLSEGSVIEYMLLRIEEREKRGELGMGTAAHQRVVVDSLLSFKKIKRIKDLTSMNVRRWDEYLRRDGKRTQSTIYGYHKVLRVYCRELYRDHLLEETPYDHFDVERGKAPERRPLTESEVLRIREWPPVNSYLEHARDLFIFSCYTGLSYSDAQQFDYDRHVVIDERGKYFIDGSRVKTGERFFTPILWPAVEILEKYDHHLPHMTNVRMNAALHEIERLLDIRKPLTSHVARHTFATLALTKKVNISVVQRMLGHANIQTTQVYAKILSKTVEDAVDGLDDMLR